jgi:hypothetical protein
MLRSRSTSCAPVGGRKSLKRDRSCPPHQVIADHSKRRSNYGSRQSAPPHPQPHTLMHCILQNCVIQRIPVRKSSCRLQSKLRSVLSSTSYDTDRSRNPPQSGPMCSPAPRSGLQSIQTGTRTDHRRLQSTCRVLRSKASRNARAVPWWPLPRRPC